jgi:iron complex outermembrane receptor protein
MQDSVQLQRQSKNGVSSTQSSYNVKTDVVITGSRLPNDGRNPRHLVIAIDRDQIERTAARSVEELLESVAGVDVRQRGPLGVQADISIRGGTFEQTLVLVDGIKMIDPQTGHHSMNIPLALDDIERIEVLKGPASRQYGPNAFTGAVNIITRKFREATARLQAMGGQNGLYEFGFTVALPTQLGANNEATLGNRLSVLRRRSNGYPALDSTGAAITRSNTDFDITTISAAADLVSASGFALEANASFVEKKFGANSFYSPLFPQQYEETRTVLAGFTARFDNLLQAGAPLVARAYWRRNMDYFVLRRENPAFYRNEHVSNTYGAELQQTLYSSLGATALGMEFAWDTLASSNLGQHQRKRWSVFAEHQWKPMETLTIEGGCTAQYNSDWGWNVAPGADIGWQIFDDLSLRASVGQSFRVPTYTDLYYSDRANVGNPNLVPERAWTYELGATWRFILDNTTLHTTVTGFRRDAAQVIDFIKNRDSLNARWQAQNISSLIVNGADIHITASFQHLNSAQSVLTLERAALAYTLLDPRFSTEDALLSRYALDQLRHHVVSTLDIVWFGTMRNQWRMRYEERVGFTGNWFADVRFAWMTPIAGLEMYAECSNLFNNTPRDLDIIGLPIAGRWLRIGGTVNFASLWK